MNSLSWVLLSRKIKKLFGALPSGFPDEWQFVKPLTIDKGGFLETEYSDDHKVEHLTIHKSWHYPGLTTSNGKPKAIVWHYSDTAHGTARNMAKRRTVPWPSYAASFRLQNPGQPVPQTSWHASIEGDGTIIQMASFKAGCWHAASTTSKGIPGIGSANRTALGIELIGKGKEFPDAQVLAAARLVAAIKEWAHVERKYAQITHAEIDPKRRVDPGPVWMSKHMDPVLEYAYAEAA